MKRIVFVVMAFVIALFAANAAIGKEPVPVRRTICGGKGVDIIRSFRAWENASIDFTSWMDAEELNIYTGEWSDIKTSFTGYLYGFVKFRFNSDACLTMNGISHYAWYLDPKFVDIGFEDLFLFSANPNKDRGRIEKALKKIGLDAGSVKAMLVEQAEGMETFDTHYNHSFQGKKLIIPSNNEGFLDTSRLSYGNRKISLPSLVPHFLLVPATNVTEVQ
jgi:hypothetical protein